MLTLSEGFLSEALWLDHWVETAKCLWWLSMNKTKNSVLKIIDFFQNAPIALHYNWWGNAVANLGWARCCNVEEYIGQPIMNFFADEQELLRRYSDPGSGNTIRDVPVRSHKDGRIRTYSSIQRQVRRYGQLQPHAALFATIPAASARPGHLLLKETKRSLDVRSVHESILASYGHLHVLQSTCDLC
jgi:hypothetical protein